MGEFSQLVRVEEILLNPGYSDVFSYFDELDERRERYLPAAVDLVGSPMGHAGVLWHAGRPTGAISFN